MELTLAILAAGLGRRFGGDKQFAPLGPSGETLPEYAAYDARRAGFTSIVVVTRPSLHERCTAYAEQRLGPLLPVRVVEQETASLPAGRVAPWGTAHAVLALRPVVRGPFAVLNADDFYGAEAFRELGNFLQVGSEDFAVVSYPLGQTLSRAGGVNRGVIERGEEGHLARIEEVLEIATSGDTIIGRTATGPAVLKEQARVSMNLWGFTPAVFELLRDAFDRFRARRDIMRDEFSLPTAVQEMIERGAASVRVLDSGDGWFGVTHAGDAAPASRALGQLVQLGAYPTPLR